ncbi:hypothetical protein LQZ18_03305 [Lachnospiraceae bacterium ZAX-1]
MRVERTRTALKGLEEKDIAKDRQGAIIKLVKGLHIRGIVNLEYDVPKLVDFSFEDKYINKEQKYNITRL